MLYEVDFMYKYNICKKYHDIYGNLLIPTNFVMDGVDIGIWIKSLRYSRKTGSGIVLTKERIALLDQIGMVWSARDYNWLLKYELLKKAILENIKYSKLNLDKFVTNLRKSYSDGKLAKWKIDLLDEIGFPWKVQYDWDYRYDMLKSFYEKYGCYDFSLCSDFKLVNFLKRWCDRQRYDYKNGKLSLDKERKLRDINFDLDVRFRSPDFDWDAMYQLACEYSKKHGNLLVSQNDGPLGKWITKQRLLYNKGLLDRDKVIKLNDIGMVWFVQNTAVNYDRARKLLIETLKMVRDEISNNNVNYDKKVRKIQYK